MPTRFNITALGDYIVKGPSQVWKSGQDSFPYYVQYARLGQLTHGKDPQEGLTLYFPDVNAGQVAPRNRFPIVRKVVWYRFSDLRRHRTEDLSWPDLTEEFFRVQRKDFGPFDAAFRTLDSTLSELHLQSRGLSVAFLYDKSSRIQRPVAEISARGPTREVRRDLMRFTDSVDFDDLTFYASRTPLNAAWEGIWNVMAGICAPSRAVLCETSYYPMSAEWYATALGRDD